MLTKTSYVLLLFAGLATLPVFFSGEGTEEAVEHLPGVSESVIESHEDVAKLALIAISAAGLLALVALLTFSRQTIARVFKMVVLLLAVASGGLMAQSAHLGGQIRHTEIRSGASAQNANQNEGGQEGGNAEQEKDDD